MEGDRVNDILYHNVTLAEPLARSLAGSGFLERVEDAAFIVAGEFEHPGDHDRRVAAEQEGCAGLYLNVRVGAATPEIRDPFGTRDGEVLPGGTTNIVLDARTLEHKRELLSVAGTIRSCSAAIGYQTGTATTVCSTALSRQVSASCHTGPSWPVSGSGAIARQACPGPAPDRHGRPAARRRNWPGRA
jgi:hypothetical protein